VGSTAGVISGLSPGAEKAGEGLQTTYVPNGTTDITITIHSPKLFYYFLTEIERMPVFICLSAYGFI
jgi:hypothetical protein